MITPGSANPLLAAGADAYQISRSLRFNSADSAHLSRTPAAAGNRRTWTWSAWIKLGSLASSLNYPNLFGTASNDEFFIYSATYTDCLSLLFNGSTAANILTTQVFRDTSAWYHIVLQVDTTQATASNRVRIYVNGTQITAFQVASYPAQNYESTFNAAQAQNIGNNTKGRFFNGYMTEINFIDGQALTPSSFGQNDPNTGVWSPIKYTGTYGTNGFYLNFSDNSNTTAATLGKDSSGNGNNWTPNNFSVTAGAGNDSLVDTPTPYGSDTGVGGEVRGNYATWNLLDRLDGSLANGNLDSTTGTVGGSNCRGTFGMSTGKWYFEVTPITNGGIADIGISVYPGTDAKNGTFYTYQADTGNKSTNSGATAFGATYTTNDVIGVAYDADAGKVWFAKNGTWQASGNPASGTNEAYSGISTPAFSYLSDRNVGSTCTAVLNAGQRPFAYTAPSGFKALCTQNLPTPTIGATSTTQANKYFDTAIWTGDGTSPRSITGFNFQPDFVWSKSRSLGVGHTLFDAVRTAGATRALYSNSTEAEGGTSGSTSSSEFGYVSAFNSNGFQVTAGSTNRNYVNNNTSTYVAWCWNGGGSTVTNTSGSITSSVRANTTAGFSIVTWAGSGAAGTIGHGLGAVPGMLITKNRNQGTDGNWVVWHRSLTGSNTVTDAYYMYLNGTNGQNASGGVFYKGTDITSTTFGFQGGNTNVNASGSNYVCYAFAPVAGYSAFGSYTGNGSTDGPFVYLGFRPRWILIKNSSAAASWYIYDAVRNTFNVVDKLLYPNLSNVEDTYTFGDILSNGFKIRSTDSGMNGNGNTIIYAAFAENPFKYSLAR